VDIKKTHDGNKNIVKGGDRSFFFQNNIPESKSPLVQADTSQQDPSFLANLKLDVRAHSNSPVKMYNPSKKDKKTLINALKSLSYLNKK